MKNILAAILSVFLVGKTLAQCPAGQTNVIVLITPDFLGGEITWDLKNAGTQFSYGSGGPYANGNTTPISTNVCVPNATNVTFLIEDASGNGLCCASGSGNYTLLMASDTVWKNGSYGYSDSTGFLAPPVNKDLMATKINLPPIGNLSDKLITGTFVNRGLSAVTSLSMRYMVNGTGTVLETRSGLNIPRNKKYDFTFVTPWVPGSPGQYTIEVDATLVNGSADLNTTNDKYVKTIYIAEHLAPRQVLLEAFTSTTDTLGFFSEQILDSVISTNKTRSAAIKYHVGFPPPGDDPMFLRDSALMNNRKNFYAIPGNVPRVVLDGNTYSGPAYGVDQAAVDADLAELSPFDVVLDETKSGNVIGITLKVISLAQFTGTNMRAFVAITEDPVHFASPPSPGSHTDFTHVMRALLPNTSGSDLGSPGSGQEFNLLYNYTVNTTELVEENLRTVVFIEDMNSKKVWQALEGDTTSGFNHATTINGIAGNVKGSDCLFVYPNPASDKLFIQLKNIAEEKCLLEIFDITGRILYREICSNSVTGNRIEIPVEELAQGIYFAKVSFASGYGLQKFIKH